MADKEYTRRFSLEDDFMNYSVNDLLYGFMRSLSTVRPIYKNGTGKVEEYREYLPKKEFVKNKKVIAGICGCTTKTIGNHLEKLAEMGLIDEGIEVVETVDKKNNLVTYEFPCYWFPYDTSGRYKILDRDMVKYLVDTRNA